MFYGSFFALFLCFFCLIFFLISYIVYYKCDCSCIIIRIQNELSGSYKSSNVIASELHRIFHLHHNTVVL